MAQSAYRGAVTTPLGLTATAYSRLLACGEVALTQLADAPAELQAKARALLEQPPASRFVHVHGNKVCLEDLRMSELVGAGV